MGPDCRDPRAVRKKPATPPPPVPAFSLHRPERPAGQSLLRRRYRTEVVALRFCDHASSFEPIATGRSLP
jgi:hypothetical protein